MKAYGGPETFHLFVVVIVFSRFIVLCFCLFLILAQSEHLAVFLGPCAIVGLIDDEQVPSAIENLLMAPLYLLSAEILQRKEDHSPMAMF